MADTETANVTLLRRWYAFHVKSNQEITTQVFLESRNITCFVPCYEQLSVRRQKRVVLKRPLFTGYVFIHLDLYAPERIEALRAPGAVRLVGFGEAPTPVPDPVIDSLRILVSAMPDQVAPHPLVREGSRVKVVEGPFRGAIGVVHVESGRKVRLVVEIEFLNRAVSVPIEARQLQPILGD